jgi:tetratricopeptide (TPR) repeat protein
MRLALLILTVVCFVAGGDFSEAGAATDEQNQNRDAGLEAHLVSGCKLRKDRQFKEALKEFDAAIKLACGDWRAHFYKSHCLSRLGKLQKALAEVRIAIKLSPEQAEPRLLCATVIEQIGNKNKAALLYQDFLENYPDSEFHFRAAVDLVRCLSKMHKFEEACKLGTSLLEDRNIDPNFLLELADTMKSMARLDLEIEAYKKYVQLFPDGPGIKAVQARLAYDTGEYQRYQSGTYPRFLPGSPWNQPQHFPRTVCITAEKGTPPYLVTLSRNCFDEWQSASSGLVFFKFIKEPDKADIVFAWTSKTGVSQILTDACHRSQVSQLDKHRQEYIESSFSSKIDRLEFRQRSLHEIGHALGLLHTLVPDDIMCAFRSPDGRARKISKHDLYMLRQQYPGDSPQSLTPAGPPPKRTVDPGLT